MSSNVIYGTVFGKVISDDPTIHLPSLLKEYEDRMELKSENFMRLARLNEPIHDRPSDTEGE